MWNGYAGELWRRSTITSTSGDRTQQGPATGLNGDTQFRLVADQWIESVDRLTAQGARSDEVDLGAGTVRIEYTAIRIKGVGSSEGRQEQRG